MKLGLQVPRFDWAAEPAAIASGLADIARRAEEAGFASIWVMDHLLQISVMGQKDDPMLEAYTTLGYIAAATREIQMGPLVGAVVYRHPGLLIKAATTLNVLSEGRSYFSIGAAWYAEEAQALGLPFPDRNTRFEMLEEVLQAAHQMWKDDASPFQGKHVNMAWPVNHPQPVSSPRPPIMIGGNGERRTLRLVAQYGDATNLLSLEPDEVRAKLQVLREHAERLGRPYDEIERTSLNPRTLDSEASNAVTLEWLHSMAEAGIQHAIINLPSSTLLRDIDTLGTHIIPKIRDF